MTKINKRLATIKYCIVMNDLEILDIQIGLLYQLELDSSTSHILTLLKNSKYQEAVNEISTYLESSQLEGLLEIEQSHNSHDWVQSRLDNDWIFRLIDWICDNTPHWKEPHFREELPSEWRTLDWYTIPEEIYKKLSQEIYGDLTNEDLCLDYMDDDAEIVEDRYIEYDKCCGAIDANIRQKYYHSLTEIDLTIFSNPKGTGFGDISCIPPEIGRFVNLEQLVLPGNVCLGGLPSEINQLNNLTEIHLKIWAEKKAEWLPKIISDMASIPSLKRLFIDSIGSLNIPSEIGLLVNLKELHIIVSMDCISTKELVLPSEIGLMTSLTTLVIQGSGQGFMFFEDEGGGIYDYTGIDFSLPLEIGQLENLTELVLDYLPMSKLPFEIGKLNNLRKLSLSQLDLSILPSSLGQLKNLEMLSISDNHLKGLPDELTSLSNLKELSVQEALEDYSVLDRLYQKYPYLK